LSVYISYQKKVEGLLYSELQAFSYIQDRVYTNIQEEISGGSSTDFHILGNWEFIRQAYNNSLVLFATFTTLLSFKYMPFWLSLVRFINAGIWTAYSLIYIIDIYVLVSLFLFLFCLRLLCINCFPLTDWIWFITFILCLWNR